ncbi:MAG: hypothetical protein WCG47_30815, partial [Dermatophilaceae bacterium]
MLDKAATRMARLSAEQTDTMLAKLTRQFDPADPTSPFAKQVKVLETQQTTLASVLERNHVALAGKVDELTTVVRVATAAKAAASTVASVTPLKGASYAGQVHRILDQLTAEMGDEYADTGNFAGSISRCKKGDGVLTLTGGQARVVLEMSDSRAALGTPTWTRRSATATRRHRLGWCGAWRTTRATPSACSDRDG